MFLNLSFLFYSFILLFLLILWYFKDNERIFLRTFAALKDESWIIWSCLPKYCFCWPTVNSPWGPNNSETMHVTDFKASRQRASPWKVQLTLPTNASVIDLPISQKKKQWQRQCYKASHAQQDRGCNFAHCPFGHTKSDRHRKRKRTAGKGRWLSSFTVRLQSTHASVTAACPTSTTFSDIFQGRHFWAHRI